MTTMDWLNERATETQTRLERLAELIEVNGGLRVTGYGYVSGGGPYGRHGLEIGEAFELLETGGTLIGFHLARPDEMEQAKAAIVEQIGKQIAAYRASVTGEGGGE